MKNRRTKIYISGPMSGLSRDEYMARFTEAAIWLISFGFDVCNPIWFLPCRYTWIYRLIGYRLTLVWDILHLPFCDEIVYLPGSDQSRGARAERRAAERIGMPTALCQSALQHHMKRWIEDREKENQSKQ